MRGGEGGVPAQLRLHRGGEPADVVLGYADRLGRVYLVGRAKEILLLPTGRATPGAIEEHLLECAFVRDRGIVALDSTGEFDKLGACVVVEHPDRLDEVRATLASFQPRLDRVRFMPLRWSRVSRTDHYTPAACACTCRPIGLVIGRRSCCGCFPAGGGPR